MDITVLLGRMLYSAIFIFAAFGHFTQKSIDYAAVFGVPMPAILVPLSGVISLLGGISILLGYKARIGAWLIILFLIPVTLIMHKFWGVEDATLATIQLSMFMKNLALIGGALFLIFFGSGPYSLDRRL